MSGVIRIDDFATASTVMRDDASFAPIDLAGYLRLLETESGRDLRTLIHLASNTPFFLDGPRHLTLHRLSVKYLSAVYLEPWRSFMEQAAERQLDALACAEAPDLMRDYISPFYRTITGAVLGFDASDAARFERWVKDARDLLEPLVSLRRIRRLQETIRELMEHIESTQTAPLPGCPEPLLHRFQAQLSEEFTRRDATGLITVLFVASQTTSQTLSNIVADLLRGSLQERERIAGAAGSTWFPAELEQLLRLHASPQFVDRIARQEQVVQGCPFHAGDHLHMHLPSANRDISAFPKTESCNARRNASAGHLSFGAGAHRCPGSTFARMTIGIALPKLFARFSTLSLAVDEPEWEDTTFIHAPASLPCILDPVFV